MQLSGWNKSAFFERLQFLSEDGSRTSVRRFLYLAMHDLVVNGYAPLEQDRWSIIWVEMLFDNFLPIADSLTTDHSSC